MVQSDQGHPSQRITRELFLRSLTDKRNSVDCQQTRYSVPVRGCPMVNGKVCNVLSESQRRDVLLNKINLVNVQRLTRICINLECQVCMHITAQHHIDICQWQIRRNKNRHFGKKKRRNLDKVISGLGISNERFHIYRHDNDVRGRVISCK